MTMIRMMEIPQTLLLNQGDNDEENFDENDDDDDNDHDSDGVKVEKDATPK